MKRVKILYSDDTSKLEQAINEFIVSIEKSYGNTSLQRGKLIDIKFQEEEVHLYALVIYELNY